MDPVTDDFLLSLDGPSAGGEAWGAAQATGASLAQGRLSCSIPGRPNPTLFHDAYAGAQPDRWPADSTLLRTSVKVSDLMVLGEALRILARLERDGLSGGSVCDAAALGCATIQMVLDQFS